VYEGGIVTRFIEVAGTSKSPAEKAASGFDMAMPVVILLIPGFLTWLFGGTAPELFAPGVLEASDSLRGAVFATFAWSVAVAAFVFICRNHEFASWITLGLTAIACLAAANSLAWVFNFQTFADSPMIPVYTTGAWPQIVFGTIGGIIGAGITVYGIGGLITGGVAGGIAGWWASEKMGR
jgi:hypothetical protein